MSDIRESAYMCLEHCISSFELFVQGDPGVRGPPGPRGPEVTR